ncbi:PspC domain-containing protein [Actinokineospora sp. NBRC 105648]|uniref:PspC domain-containing protein n=1 Tax=Actinokineospora sp. NBRC 105648 TaxID=3032206 RepID=UPI0024A288AA|nr:PspC domain-containing protein [Actinokineospora sp. NBRC 105648]GLZ42061.1 PspC family transcriptional regulator [Actinokineospora sp. NBRC 105648]
MSGTSNQAHGAKGVEDTLKDFWATRPRRPRQGRKVAGVAAAIGNRYGIDPVIARVGFVVATFYGGAGVVFYLLGWLFFAEVDDEVSPVESVLGKGRSSSSTAFTIALGIGVVVAFSAFLDHDFSGWLGVAVAAGLVYLLHRTRGHLGTPGTPVAAEQPTTAMPPTTGMPTGMPTGAPTMTMPTASAPTQAAPTESHVYPTEPPAWDPLGAAPFAWDLPEPSSTPEPEPPAPRKRSKVGAITLAAAFLFVGAAVIVEPYGGAWVSVRHILGVVLGILGAGMVVGSFFRGGRGLIGLAMPVAALGIALTALWPNGFSPDGVGDLTVRPLTIDQVNDTYDRDIGSIEVDLTGLPATGELHTRAEVGVGDVTVIVPRDADVEVYCSVGVGDVDCLGEQQGGASPELSKTDLGADGEGGLQIKVDAEVHGPGSVKVRRG